MSNTDTSADREPLGTHAEEAPILSQPAKWKSVCYLLEVIFTFAVLALGIAACGQMMLESSSSPLEVMASLAQMLLYLIPTGLQLLLIPSVTFSVAFWIFVYAGSLVFFAQTERQKKFLWVVFPAAFLGALLTVTAGLAVALSGLASQGAGT